MLERFESYIKTVGAAKEDDYLLALSSFVTQFAVALILFIYLWFLEIEGLEYRIAANAVLFSAMIGSFTGYRIWNQGRKKLAAVSSTAGLLVAGSLTYYTIGTIGGVTGILFLAAILTAASLSGARGVLYTTLFLLIASPIGFIFIDRPLYPMSESVNFIYLYCSFWSWGLYMLTWIETIRRSQYTLQQSLQEQNLTNSKQAQLVSLGIIANSTQDPQKLWTKIFDSLSHFYSELKILRIEEDPDQYGGVPH